MVKLMTASRYYCCSCCPLLWLLFCCCLGTGADGRWRGPQPEFGEAENTVKVQEGQTARLPCVVLHLNDRAVTWLRRRDLHILTTGHHTYSADDRFQVVHSPGSDQWPLVVTYTQLRDSGIYECQINTDPKLSRPVMLNVYNSSQPISVSKSKVFVANNTASTKDGHLRVEILGARELYIEEGSSLTLKCLVTSSFGPSTLVYWYHDTRLIDYASPRGGIKLKIDHERGETIARLVVETVTTEDSGMYSCVPSGSHPASVRVHVQQAGEQKAAIQQGGLNDTSSSTRLTPLPLMSCFLPLLLLSLPYLILSLPVLPSLLTFLASVVLCVSIKQVSLPFLYVPFIYLTSLLLIESISFTHSLHLHVFQYLKKHSSTIFLVFFLPFSSVLSFSNLHSVHILFIYRTSICSLSIFIIPVLFNLVTHLGVIHVIAKHLDVFSSPSSGLASFGPFPFSSIPFLPVSPSPSTQHSLYYGSVSCFTHLFSVFFSSFLFHFPHPFLTALSLLLCLHYIHQENGILRTAGSRKSKIQPSLEITSIYLCKVMCVCVCVCVCVCHIQEP